VGRDPHPDIGDIGGPCRDAPNLPRLLQFPGWLPARPPMSQCRSASPHA
jgi:hypothetical protein